MIRFNAAAIDDMEEQIAYLVRMHEIDAVGRFEEAIMQTAQRAEALPRGHPVSEVAAQLGHDDWRKTPVGRWPHLMFYRPIPNGIEVLRIISGRRNLERALR